jgi:hypothetical protein
MINIKVREATPTQLDWLVAKCEGKAGDCVVHADNVLYGRVTSGFVQYSPSTNWSQSGPIIYREGISWHCANKSSWHAYSYGSADNFNGPTPLIAAMRAFVASKLGDTVEVPEELT